MSLTCYLIDDEAHALEVLQDHIRRTPGLELLGQSTDPLAGLEAISRLPGPDLIFLDVDMPGLSGLTLAGLAQPRTIIIFTTSYREFAADAFEKDAADLLLKPIFYERFLKSIRKARQLRQAATPAAAPFSLLVKTGIKGQVRQLRAEDIRYVEAASNYLVIYLKDERLVTYLSLTELSARLPASRFSRIHRSYLVNHDFIRTIEHAQLRLTDRTCLPIGRTFRQAFQDRWDPARLPGERDQPA